MASSGTLKLDFVTLDVFTDTRFLGNPLAVVFVPATLQERLDQKTKQRIAREFNLSETVFLHTLENEPNTGVTTRQIDIFTIEQELPFAGHPTIGSAYLVLHHLGWTHVDTLLTKAGPIRIQPLKEGRATPGVRAAIPHAVHVHQQTLGSVLESASPTGPTASAINRGLPDDPEIRAAELAAPVVSIVKGMTFLLVRLPSLAHLARIGPLKRLELAKVPDLLDQGEWHESFVARYHYVPLEEDSVASDGSRHWAIQTRNLELGFEDPATGSAACTLASYLTLRGKADRGAHFAITQGVEMGRRSDITVDVVTQADESGEVKIKELYLGGTAAVVMSGSISV
ncbi:hypothetical protein VTK56DRAFT_5885 [Thermocarpiscus australiensis]